MHEITEIFNAVENVDIFQTAHDQKCGDLRSEYAQKMYNKKKLKYVAPVEILLGYDNSMVSQLHHVPIIETVQTLLQDKHVWEQFKNPLKSELNVLQGFPDGHVFKNNHLLCGDPNTLQLMIFQDSFEVFNPIGSGRCKQYIGSLLYNWKFVSIQ